jgi:haloalkane dehalogenase
MNTTIATGTSAGPGFDQWKAYAAAHPDMPVSDVVRRGAAILTADEAAAYDAPFPNGVSKAGVRAFPERVMVSPAMEGVTESLAAVTFWSTEWSGPTFMAWGGADRVFPPISMNALRDKIRNCPEPMIIPEAGHFVQEWGEQIAQEALRAFGTPHRRPLP